MIFLVYFSLFGLSTIWSFVYGRCLSVCVSFISLSPHCLLYFICLHSIDLLLRQNAETLKCRTKEEKGGADDVGGWWVRKEANIKQAKQARGRIVMRIGLEIVGLEFCKHESESREQFSHPILKLKSV